MKKSANAGLYLGILLVLVGIIFFLDLNQLLPEQAVSQYINFILGILCFVAYLRQKRMSLLMVATFFIGNGLLITLDQRLDAFVYFAGLLLIPGLMFIVAFVVKKALGYLIPGAMLISWGIYVMLLMTDVLNGFTMTVGMAFIFTAIGFLAIFLFEPEMWAGIPSLIMGVIGIVIVTLGLGEGARHILFNITCIGVVIIGLMLIVRSLLHHHKGDQGEE